MKTPDIISVEEIQDNNGPTDNGVVDASTTYQTLINAIAAARGLTYQFRQSSLIPGGYSGTHATADKYVQVVQGSNSTNFNVQIDADGPTGGDIFRPFITVNLLGTGNLNNASNFVF